MNKILKLILSIFIFFCFILVFLPKESIYNLLEKELYTKEIIISKEIRNEGSLSFSISKYELYVKDIKIANINKSSFFSLFFYTQININEIKLLNSLKNMFPSSIESIEISHWIFQYDKLNIKSNGEFGELTANIDILNKKINIKLNASKIMKQRYFDILNQMKLKDGRYLYEYKF